MENTFNTISANNLPKTDQNLQLWNRLLSCSALIENELRSRLRTQFGTTLPRFELMSQLCNSPQGLNMSELSRRMMVTNGNITTITDQLEKDGFVERVKAVSDRRSNVVRLTNIGKKSFAKMAHAYEQWIQDIFSASSEQKRNNLYNALGKLQITVHTRLADKPL